MCQGFVKEKFNECSQDVLKAGFIMHGSSNNSNCVLPSGTIASIGDVYTPMITETKHTCAHRKGKKKKPPI